MTRIPRTAPLAGAALALLAAVATASAGEATIEFNRDVRPILAENCFACHGPDARRREADLRLDREADALAPLPGGSRAIVPGDPDASELVFRVEVDDPETVMPPRETGKVLTADQIDVLRRWVAAGARWEPHWSFAPIRRPSPPAVAGAQNPIDGFILDRQREPGLSLAPEADRATLLRRLSLDLNGLPPSSEEVDAFLADDRPGAYEKVVDRLLASPRFGERMAIFWLDLVRYADSVGYHGDQPVSVSPFRDYVIKAFNENMPFDRFTVEQLAGDLLPGPSLDQRVAAGYNRLGMMSGEGGVQPKEYLAKYSAERVRNISGAWLGVTIGCAECHDHKFDPFTARDFYRMEAFFADVQERGLYEGGDFGPMMPVPSPEQEQEKARLEGEIAAIELSLRRDDPALTAAQEEWERAVWPSIAWTTLTPLTAASASGSSLAIQDDGSILASGDRPATDTYTVTVRFPLPGTTALRVEAIPDDSLPKRGPGRADNGNFALTEFSASLQIGPDAPPQPLILRNASATFEQTQNAEKNPDKRWSAASAIDGDAQGETFGWAILGDEGHPNAAVFETATDVSGGDEAALTITLAQNLDNPGHLLGRFRISATAAPRPVQAPGAGLPRAVRDALAIAPEARDQGQNEAIRAQFRSIAPQVAPERARLAERQKARDELTKRITTMLATVTVPPRTIRVLPRGNWMDDSGEEVTPGVPGFLPQPSSGGDRLTRLDLARWIVAPENPLTARTLANRLWKLHFGAGLSRKLDDLGAQGEWPSHPELLDFLAGRLIDSGWDLKGTIRLIVTSAVYRQSSIPDPSAREKDPLNRLLARQARFRLDAELVRDSALSACGLLVERIGGPSVKPYQPPGYWSYLNFPKREWQNDTGASLYRRGLYTHWQRQYLYPSLLAFDAPGREECTAERVRSSTPLQALVLLNDPSYVEAARALAARMIREGGPDPSSRLDWACRRALSRPIRPAEREVLERLLADHLDHYRADPEAAKALLAVGESPAPANLDAIELAAWTGVARALLNLHAAITRN